MARQSWRWLGLLTLAAGAAAGAAEAPYDSDLFGGLKARAIGPATMSGRIASIDATAEDPGLIVVGAASGGVWRSTDGGISFKPIFDEHVQSIGAVRIDPTDSKVIWVGTGESRVRNSVGVGAGVFVSRDGGDSFKPAGLAQTERVAELLVSPQDGNTVFVCATGGAWRGNPERGVYRSRDGGAQWERVLHVDDDTGCSDLAMDPSNPNVLYAGMWTYRRYPDFFTSGGAGSGLYRSFDGGDSWVELHNGLPAGEKGRIAVAIAPSKTQVVYALVEAEETALYRSDDMGRSFTEVNSSANVQMRPFYFGEIKVDPLDHLRIYRPALTTTVSEDGGQSFSALSFGGGVHPDHHALWIDPRNPQRVLLGTDGGIYASYDWAAHWRFVGSLPVSQFYHVSVDMQQPYQVYGGLQDNGSWTAPSRGPAGIRNRDWDSVGFGDGFWVFADPADPQTVYSEYQGGQLLRVDRRLSEVKRIAPVADAQSEKLRFNWNTPLHLSPTQDGVLYYGSQYLHRSADRGESWQRISPDLTTDDPKRQRQAQSGGLSRDNSTAENNATLYTIAESPLDPQLLWVGSDDGLVHVSRNGGDDWRNLSAGFKGVPKGTWVSRIDASPHAAGTAFVTFDGHRTGDFATYLYRTDDYGQTWQRLGTDAVEGYAWVIRQDPVDPALLFLGTEFGLWISIDAGAHWARFKENLPKVAVHDLVVHPREHDLVIATHGRGVYIIDDLSPLRGLDPDRLGEDVFLLPTRPGQMVSGGALQAFGADDEFLGQTLEEAATIAFYQRKRHLFGDLKLKVYDAAGAEIASLPVDKRRGIVRVPWPMRLKAPKFPPSTQLVPGFVGPRVPEGDYRFELVKGKTVLEGQVSLRPDPRSPHSAEDREVQQMLAMALYRELADLTFLAEQVSDLRQRSLAAASVLGDRQGRVAREYAEQLDQLGRSLAASDTDGGYVSGEEQLRERYGNFYGEITGYDGRPSATQLQRHEQLQAELGRARGRADALFGEPLRRLNKALEAADQPTLVPLLREAWDTDQAGGGGSRATVVGNARQRLQAGHWLANGLSQALRR
ncbi:MAG: hypothetical protein R3F15_05640 [Lysobacterales bacterium]